jgi:hypothetical protein
MPTAKPTTTFTWTINTLERELSDGYVFTAHYSVNGVSSVLNPEGQPYTAEVIGWVIQKLGGTDKKAEIEAALQARIDDAISPKTINGVPW